MSAALQATTVHLLMRELMREFVQRQRASREYDEFLNSKVDAASGRSNAEVEAKFAKRRAGAAGKA